MKLILLIFLIPLLSSCTWLEGRGGDQSTLTVGSQCDVQLKQRARAAGMDDADVIERVRVSPDCTTEIDFRQTVGDSVKKIESQGGMGVLEGEQQQVEQIQQQGELVPEEVQSELLLPELTPEEVPD